MEKLNCQFCQKIFSTKSNLSNHIKRAKYCIKNRPETVDIKTDTNYRCTFCNKSFVEKDKEILLLKQRLKEKNKQLIEKSKEVEYLTRQLSSLALEGIKKSTVTNTTSNTSTRITNILSPLDLNDEKIKTIVENNLDETYFLDAQKGIARFCFDKLITTENGKRKLICSDPVRERYRYLDQEGNLKEDLGARHFIDKISKPIIETSKKVHINLKDRYSQIKEDIDQGIEKEISDYLIDIKQKYADKCLLDIHDIPYDSTNRKFRK